MKHLNIATGGHPLKFNVEDKMHLADMATEPIVAFCSSLGAQNYYLLNATPPAITGGNLVIAAGWLVYKGEPCAFDAQSVALVGGEVAIWVPVITYRSGDPQSYADSSSHSPHEIKKVQLQFCNPISLPGDYVLLEDMSSMDWAIWNEIAPEWIPISSLLVNSWTQTTGSNVVAYRIWPDGKFEFKGVITKGTNPLAFTLPSGSRPSNEIVKGVDVSNSGFDRREMTIDPATGHVSFDTGSANTDYILDGVDFMME